MAKETKSKSYIDRLKALGKKISDKFNEEVDQYKSMGGIGEYVAQNAVTVAAEFEYIAGGDEAKNQVESKREEIVTKGKKFDKRVARVEQKAKRVADEIEEKGIVPYLDQKLKSWDERHQDDAIQIPDPWSVIISGGRIKTTYTIKPLASKNKVQYTVKGETPTFVQGGPLVRDIEIQKASVYAKAEIRVDNIADNLVVGSSIIDGKKHGVEVIRDSQNQIVDVKAYDHGKPIDLKNNQVDIKQETDENGVVHNYCLLNNQLFGTETFIQPDGKMNVRFYERDGMVMSRGFNSQIFYNKGDVSGKNNQLIASMGRNQGKANR